MRVSTRHDAREYAGSRVSTRDDRRPFFIVRRPDRLPDRLRSASSASRRLLLNLAECTGGGAVLSEMTVKHAPESEWDEGR